MSNEVQIGTGVLTVRRRRPWVVVSLSVVTLGVYALVWYYKINREMRDFGIVRDDTALAESKPVRSILAITLGGLIVIPELISLVGTVGRVQRTERLATGHARSRVIPIALFTATMILSITSQVHGLALLCVPSLAAFLAAAALVQVRLNRAWSVLGTTVTGSASTADTAQVTSIAGPEYARPAAAPGTPAGL